MIQGFLYIRSLTVCPPIMFNVCRTKPLSEWDPSFFGKSRNPRIVPKFIDCEPPPSDCPVTLKIKTRRLTICNSTGDWCDVAFIVPPQIGRYRVNGPLEVTVCYNDQKLPITVITTIDGLCVYLNIPKDSPQTITIDVKEFVIPVEVVCDVVPAKILLCNKTNPR